MSDESRDPSLLEVLQAAMAAGLEGVYTTLPARVERYDTARQAVDAQPWVKVPVTRGDGTVVAERLPVVVGAPVLYPGSGPYRVTFPIAVGSTVLLVFPSTSLDRWLLVGREVDPQDPRRHSLSDAFAIPAGHAFAGDAKPATTAPQTAMVLHAELLRLGAPAAAETVAVLSELQALRTAFLAHVHPDPLSGSTGATATPVSAFTGSPTIKVP